jgi:starch synthase
MPAYRQAKDQLTHIKKVAQITVQKNEVELLKATLPGTRLPIWLVDCPVLFDREGGPYTSSKGETWPDNAKRFAVFSRVIAAIATDQLGLDWQPDILHCNDWQTALAPAILHFEKSRPGIIFTIHNLAYQGLFPYSTFVDLQLPEELWSFNSMEFYDEFSFIKGGIVYADQITTVSPTYAKEIQTEEYGAGLEKLLQVHAEKLTGIINGVNEEEWNPNKDNNIHTTYSIKTLSLKIKNKLALQKELGFEVGENIPLLASISRLAAQKGIDLIVNVLSNLKNFKVQFVILGSGEKALEAALTNAADANSEQVFVKIGYDETLAHKITSAADFFIMPSRYEPCGLNQMYSQHYGTIPIVRKTGGLADTVIDETSESTEPTKNTGIIFEKDSAADLLKAIIRGLDVYSNKKIWEKMQLNAMRQDFSWKNSATQYLGLYTRILDKQ